MKETATFDLVVVGGGSGGFGAALAAARLGLHTLLLEAGPVIGGNAALGGVNNWEMGVTSTPFAREIYDRLRQEPGQAGVTSFGRHFVWPDRNDPPFPGAESILDPAKGYEDTLRRHGTRGLAEDPEKVRQLWHAIAYEPEPYSRVLEELLSEAGAAVWTGTRYLKPAAAGDGQLQAILVQRKEQALEVRGQAFIDATADAFLCFDLGCEMMIGTESAREFGEPGAPERRHHDWVNSVSQLFRVMPQTDLPPPRPQPCWFRRNWDCGHFVQMPGGGWNVNMLPTMEGDEFLQYFRDGAIALDKAIAECRRRIEGFWEYIRAEFPEFRDHAISSVAPRLGVRETRRVLGEKILTQNELLRGYPGQEHQDLIALADHAMDFHGEKRGLLCSELEQPYGIPFGCLIPRGWKNLLVACRAASFTQIAASSCRLSRTMMSLGHAAGAAAALFDPARGFAQLDPAHLRQTLRQQNVVLDP